MSSENVRVIGQAKFPFRVLPKFQALVLPMARDTHVRLDVLAFLGKARFQESGDGVPVIRTLMAFEAGCAVHIFGTEANGGLPQTQPVIYDGTDLLTDGSLHWHVALLAGHIFLSCVHRSLRYQRVPLRKD